jgi:hypothetical protein
MDVESAETLQYLQQLYQSTAGQTEAQVSMFAVGETMGLDKTTSGKIAEDLIGNGLAEVKTLSGGIGITGLGIERVQADGGAPAAASDDLELNSGPVLDDIGRQAMETVLSKLRDHVATTKSSYDRLEELVIDLKTIEVQLLSPRPKTAIFREALFSLQSALNRLGASAMAEQLSRMTGR